MKYAVIKTQGKQYKVSEGDIIEIDHLEVKPKQSVNFDQVLLLVDGEKILLGQPLVVEVKVTASVLEQKLGKKIRVAKFKAKTGYRRVQGFRPKLTRVKIEKIATQEEEKKQIKVEKVAKKDKPTVKVSETALDTREKLG